MKKEELVEQEKLAKLSQKSKEILELAELMLNTFKDRVDTKNEFENKFSERQKQYLRIAIMAGLQDNIKIITYTM